MRKLLLASVAVLVLSSAAQAGNTSTTVQVGAFNTSNVSQQGPTTNTAALTQLGLVNNATASQGTIGISLNNGSSMQQTGIQNTSHTAQIAVGGNISQVVQNSFGPPALQSNTAAIFQLGVIGLSSVSQTAH